MEEKQNMGKKRGSIAFFTTYRPLVPLNLYSAPIFPHSKKDEILLLDEEDKQGRVSYNYNAKVIPPAALKTILSHPKCPYKVPQGDTVDCVVDTGRVTGLVFVSERVNNIETLHIALSSKGRVEVFNFAEVFGTFDGVRLEDSGCFVGGDYMVYVSTMEPAQCRRQPWTAVYKTNLKTGDTVRLTPPHTADLSPSVSPSGKKIAVASFEKKGIDDDSQKTDNSKYGWDGEIEDLKTDIFLIEADEPRNRKLLVKNGGWPTWGSDSVLFFHRKDKEDWHVIRAEINNDGSLASEHVVTPCGVSAMTPAAIDDARVAVAIIREKATSSNQRVQDQYRHIEIFDSTGKQPPLQITQKTSPTADHYNPFVVVGHRGTLMRIGYHRVMSDNTRILDGHVSRRFLSLQSPNEDVDLFRVSGVFPSFSSDGSKLAFVDNEFKAVWVADTTGVRAIYKASGPDNVFSPVWSQNPEKDTLYVCMGPSFHAAKPVQICAIHDASNHDIVHTPKPLTKAYNNAFPSTNSEGTRLVYRSTRDGGDKLYKNLYIMEDAESGEFGEGKITRLTNGSWVDTHCQWSPRGDWIVYSSTCDKPKDAPKTDNDLDPGYFAVFLVNANDPTVKVRVIGSGYDLAGHVNHPFFSPDGKSIVVTADLAAVSADPISMPLFMHSVRPYGDIFSVDVDTEDIYKNENVKEFKRITHSKYENSTPTWTRLSTDDPHAQWNTLVLKNPYTPHCPYVHPDGSESWHMTGHLMIPRKRAC